MNAPFLGPTPAAKPPKLLEQVRRCIRDKHYSLRTEEVFVYWARLSHDIDSGPNDRLRLSCARHECRQLAGYGRSIGRHERLLNATEPTFEIRAQNGDIDPHQTCVVRVRLTFVI